MRSPSSTTCGQRAVRQAIRSLSLSAGYRCNCPTSQVARTLISSSASSKLSSASVSVLSPNAHCWNSGSRNRSSLQRLRGVVLAEIPEQHKTALTTCGCKPRAELVRFTDARLAEQNDARDWFERLRADQIGGRCVKSP